MSVRMWCDRPGEGGTGGQLEQLQGRGEVQVLFDTEADNQHEEPLLLAQLAAQQLLRAPAHRQSEGHVSALLERLRLWATAVAKVWPGVASVLIVKGGAHHRAVITPRRCFLTQSSAASVSFSHAGHGSILPSQGMCISQTSICILMVCLPASVHNQ